MKKLIMSCAIALLSLSAINISAANQEPSKENCQGKTECVNNCDTPCQKDGNFDKKKGKKGKKGHKQCKDQKCNKDCKAKKCCKGKKGNPAFAGIELTAEQQAKIDAINAKRKAAVEKSREELKKAIQKDHEAYNKEVKEVLNDEQRAIYDKNIAEMKARRAEKELKRDGSFVAKGFKKDMKKVDKDLKKVEKQVKSDL